MIRVKINAAGALGFEIEAAGGKLLARSGPYRSICRSESALAVLQALAQQRTNAGLKLARQHRPSNPLELPEFMKPRQVEAAQVPAAETPALQRQRPAAPSPTLAASTGHPLHRKLICAGCEAKISFPEGRFCWNQEQRFGGLQYCREHQAEFK